VAQAVEPTPSITIGTTSSNFRMTVPPRDNARFTTMTLQLTGRVPAT
jgi:hypothetical protein